jgi:hypothetical protein
VTILDTLAAAYASIGRYADAVATEITALEIVEKAGATSAAEPIRARLELYRKRQPFVDGK